MRQSIVRQEVARYGKGLVGKGELTCPPTCKTEPSGKVKVKGTMKSSKGENKGWRDGRLKNWRRTPAGAARVLVYTI
jgi:hypothetical protein